MQLYFIRHGQSTNNALWVQQSDYRGRNEDPGLTNTGCQQVQLLADYLVNANCDYTQPMHEITTNNYFGLTHLYTSLMVRAVATGAIISQSLDLPLVAWPEIHEGGGIYLDDEENETQIGLPGKGKSYFEDHYPELILPDWLDESGWWNRPFETRPQRRERARQFLIDLIARHANTNDHVVIISHGGFYNHFLSVLLNLHGGSAQPSQDAEKEKIAENLILSAEIGIWFELNNTGISKIEIGPEVVRLRFQNKTDHLPDELVT